MLAFKRILPIISCLLLLALPVTVSAASAKTSKTDATTPTATATTPTDGNTNQSVTQGYGSTSALQKGMLVQLDAKDPTKVDALTIDTQAQLLGVVVAANDATVALSNNANSGQVFVASFGHYDVLVSNQNGPIKKGDYITISSLAGVGMKVDTTQPYVLGRATADFTGISNVESSAKLKVSGGKDLSVSIGRIPVDVSISHNPLQQSIDKALPSFLRKASEQIAGKPVGTSRVYISLAILFMASIIAGGILYSGIRGGLIAIGRNPLAKKSVVGGIVRVVLSGVIVFVIGLFGVYLILKL